VTRSTVLDTARSYENQLLSKASADASSSINTAQSERARLVNDVQSQADRFNEVLPRFRANPNLFVQQRLNDTFGRILTNVQDKVLVPDSSNGKSIEMRYLLNRELPKPRTNAPAM
jgi:regulator of protease activity HflC (stomatin/prohibitin superfamily)